MKKSVGETMRCPKCNQYMPDRCICNVSQKAEEKRCSECAWKFTGNGAGWCYMFAEFMPGCTKYKRNH